MQAGLDRCQLTRGDGVLVLLPLYHVWNSGVRRNSNVEAISLSSCRGCSSTMLRSAPTSMSLWKVSPPLRPPPPTTSVGFTHFLMDSYQMHHLYVKDETVMLDVTPAPKPSVGIWYHPTGFSLSPSPRYQLCTGAFTNATESIFSSLDQFRSSVPVRPFYLRYVTYPRFCG